ncbi:MAG: Hydrogenase 4 subunit B [Candidatus Ozemobacter sibiricus]|uniref:Hydrogenase 4 subunit B n=1 Tax=Candidatus Ozemobacter sibiricus TaxID=2268124 RepID=A0A367ZQ38_9BACT|nr:MAG: Hydrogenase 4 subunit B [Candidatus Ozemobacter sibiricus]
MNHGFLIAAVIFFPLLGGLVGRMAGFHAGLARLLAATGAVLGGLAGALLSGDILWHGSRTVVTWPWFGTGYTLTLAVDPLSAFFLLPVSILTAMAAIYGAQYLGFHHHTGPAGVGAAGAASGVAGRGMVDPANVGLFASLLQTGMVLVLLAHDGLGFLFSWEVMSMAAFFLIALDDANAENRSAAWTYLLATHIGSAFLVLFFLFLGQRAGGLTFAELARATLSERAQALLFLAALVGFGAKAGFMPLHVWLPDAHPAAPSHLSAVMSGVMIKTGIYGLLRALTVLGAPPVWWGWALVVIGVVSGIMGMVFALAERDVKRLLAYSSVENIGIIAIGLGLGLCGRATAQPAMAVAGFAGSLLHVLNHAMFKGLLFLGAGTLAVTTGTRELDRLGGLFRRMPATAGACLAGVVAIGGLPPLNGFLSEFLIYVAAFQGLLGGQGFAWLPSCLAIGGLALIGGLAAACFAKVYGIAFLGEPRTQGAAEAAPPPALMSFAMITLAMLCGGLAVVVPVAVPGLAPVLSVLVPIDGQTLLLELLRGGALLRGVLGVAILLVLLVGFLAAVRRRLLAGREIGQTPTWDCGYAAPTPRMSYTGSSFTQPLNDLFEPLRAGTVDRPALSGLFPAPGRLATHPADSFVGRLYTPLFTGVETLCQRLRWVQAGRLQVYVLYIAVTLLVLLGWNLW